MTSDIVKVALIAAAPATIAAILGAFNRKSVAEVVTKVDGVSERVDGRLTELLELTRKSSLAQGIKEEKERAPKKTASRRK
jgi:hypothetical protein